MKKNRLTSSRTVRLVLALAFYSATIITSKADLISHWEFDEGEGDIVLDSTGNHNGQIFGGVSRVAGQIGSGALWFNGVDGYVEIAGISSDLELVNTPYSIAFWLRYEGGMRVINMDDGNDTSGGYSFWIRPAGLAWTHNNTAGENGNWFSTGVLPSGDWEHFAMVWDGDNRLIYVDGIQTASLPTTFPLSSDGDDPLWFGGIPVYGQFFQGALDDVRIYNHALTAAEVATLNDQPQVVIDRNPTSLTIRQGSEIQARFDVQAHIINPHYPTSELSYQWQRNGIDIVDATNSTYILTDFSIDDSGSRFQVQISHPQIQGSQLSQEAYLVVLDASALPTLLGHWKFDEGSGDIAVDSIGNNDGAINDGIYVEGRFNTALEFNGTSTFVAVGGIGTSLELVDTSYVISWWQRWDGPVGRHNRIINMNDGNDFSAGYSLDIVDGRIVATHNNGLDMPQDWDTGITPITNWQHFALVWDGTLRTLYVDGRYGNAIPTSVDLFSDEDDPLWFGAIPNYGQYFKGALDDVRIYQGAMTADEVSALVPRDIALSIGLGSSSNEIIISWPQLAVGFYLESADRLSGLWSPVTNSVTAVDGRNTVTVGATDPTRFYRLKKQ